MLTYGGGTWSNRLLRILRPRYHPVGLQKADQGTTPAAFRAIKPKRKYVQCRFREGIERKVFLCTGDSVPGARNAKGGNRDRLIAIWPSFLPRLLGVRRGVDFH